jgi:hypothetical protein
VLGALSPMLLDQPGLGWAPAQQRCHLGGRPTPGDRRHPFTSRMVHVWRYAMSSCRRDLGDETMGPAASQIKLPADVGASAFGLDLIDRRYLPQTLPDLVDAEAHNDALTRHNGGEEGMPPSTRPRLGPSLDALRDAETYRTQPGAGRRTRRPGAGQVRRRPKPRPRCPIPAQPMPGHPR